MVHSSRMTCRHFRYQVPREYADELRDADPEPCPVCDALPHREATANAVTTFAQRDNAQGVIKSGWLVQLFSGKREEVMPAGLPVPVRAAA
jgi:hypothetical protein